MQVAEVKGRSVRPAATAKSGAARPARRAPAARATASCGEAQPVAYPKPNSHGVFVCDERFDRVRHVEGRWSAEVTVIQIGMARWAYGYDYSMTNAGGCSAPSKSWTVTSRDEAFVRGLVIVVTALARIATGRNGSVDSDASRRVAKRTIEGLFAAVPEVIRKHVVAKVIEGRDHG